MRNNGLLDSPVFSFRVGPSEDDAGEAVFGGIDDNAYEGKITYVPVRRKAYWEVELEKVSFGDDELELENTGAAIDTGKSPIYRNRLCSFAYHESQVLRSSRCPPTLLR
jgi:saccharopepsin